MTNEEIEELTNRVLAMDAEELRVVVDTLPIELVYNRVGRELKRMRELEHQLQEIHDFAVSREVK